MFASEYHRNSFQVQRASIKNLKKKNFEDMSSVLLEWLNQFNMEFGEQVVVIKVHFSARVTNDTSHNVVSANE